MTKILKGAKIMLMFVKMLGIILVMASSGLIGLYYSNMDGYRISDLLEMKRAISILQSEIEYTGTPLAFAAVNVAERTKGAVSEIFERLGAAVEINKHDSMAVIWENALLPAKAGAYFAKKDIEQFLAFGSALGYLDNKMQLKNINITLDYIEDSVKELNENKARNKRMYSTVGFLSGMLIVIVLI